jgi:hypothetical protein
MVYPICRKKVYTLKSINKRFVGAKCLVDPLSWIENIHKPLKNVILKKVFALRKTSLVLIRKILVLNNGSLKI